MSIIDRIKRDAERRTEGKYLQLKDKEQVRIRFLQELDATRPGYDEKFGLAEYVLVHSNPKNFKRSAACTADTEGKCWACDQANGPEKEAYKWKPKGKLYVNVLVKSPEGDKVKVLQQGMSDKHIANILIENDAEYGSITDRDYKLKRSGDGMNNTSYLLTSLEKSPLELDGLELIDLKTLVKKVPYSDQETYFNSTDEENKESSESSGW